MDLNRIRSLSPRLRALVAVAVLLDGREAGTYLASDANDGEVLKKAADSLSAEDVELRMPVAGTLLREALKGI